MSLKTSQEAVSGNGFSFPWPLNWSNFSDAWTLTNFPRAFIISLWVAVFTVAGEIVVCSMTAYAIARELEQETVPVVLLLPARRDVHPVPGDRAAAGQADLPRPPGQPGRCDHAACPVRARFQRAAVHRVPALGPLRAGGERAHGRLQHLADLLEADLPPAGTDECDSRHLRVPGVLERLHAAQPDHLEPNPTDAAGRSGDLPDAVQLELQHLVRVVPDGDAAYPHRLPLRPTLGHVRSDPGSHQVAVLDTLSSPGGACPRIRLPSRSAASIVRLRPASLWVLRAV